MTVSEELRPMVGVVDHAQLRSLDHATDPLQLEQQFIVLAADQRGDLVLRRQPHLDPHAHEHNPEDRVSQP
jgi:hypothetical protein